MEAGEDSDDQFDDDPPQLEHTSTVTPTTSQPSVRASNPRKRSRPETRTELEMRLLRAEIDYRLLKTELVSLQLKKMKSTMEDEDFEE